MLSETQGASHLLAVQQQRAAVPVNSPISPNGVATAVSSVDATSIAAREVLTPKVQAPKPIELKVDIEKMRANLQESLTKLNEALRDGGRNLNFSMDEKLGGLVVVVKNSDTGEVVRQIPNDAVIRMAHSIEAFKGMLHNEFS